MYEDKENQWHGDYRGYSIRSYPGSLRGDRQFYVEKFDIRNRKDYYYREVASEEQAKEHIDEILDEGNDV